MIPLRDSIPSSRFPLVTLALVALNVAVFLWQLQLGPRLDRALIDLAIIPAFYTDAEIARRLNPVQLGLPFFSSMFLHGGWVHLLGNMWILWVFGDNVEDRLGRWKYLVFYLGSGIVAALVHVFTNAQSPVPTIGASGAVAGVMGAYFRLFPRARVMTLIPPFFLGPYYVLPAMWFLGWWFLLQFFSGALSLSSAGRAAAGIAWWAHVGGFAFGVLMCLLTPRRRGERTPD
jgi:hypothetical protein